MKKLSIVMAAALVAGSCGFSVAKKRCKGGRCAVRTVVRRGGCAGGTCAVKKAPVKPAVVKPVEVNNVVYLSGANVQEQFDTIIKNNEHVVLVRGINKQTERAINVLHNLYPDVTFVISPQEDSLRFATYELLHPDIDPSHMDSKEHQVYFFRNGASWLHVNSVNVSELRTLLQKCFNC